MIYSFLLIMMVVGYVKINKIKQTEDVKWYHKIGISILASLVYTAILFIGVLALCVIILPFLSAAFTFNTITFIEAFEYFFGVFIDICRYLF